MMVCGLYQRLPMQPAVQIRDTGSRLDDRIEHAGVGSLVWACAVGVHGLASCLPMHATTAQRLAHIFLNGRYVVCTMWCLGLPPLPRSPHQPVCLGFAWHVQWGINQSMNALVGRGG